jgi:glycosyltransferase involved in cell wall biosynthesis
MGQFAASVFALSAPSSSWLSDAGMQTLGGRHTLTTMSLVAPKDGVTSLGRVGLVYRSGSPSEKAWSGIPAGLTRGLSQLGFESYSIDAEPIGSVTRLAKGWATVGRRNRHGGMFAPEVRELRRLTARLRAYRVGRLDAIIQMGSDFGVPLPGRLVTYEDMTVVQRARVDRIEDVLGSTAIQRWVCAQSRCYENALGCCAMSRPAADSIISDYGVDAAKVHVVWAGRNYDPRPVVRDWTQPRFFFMGYDWQRKNGALVLQAFARLRSRVPNARLDIAGSHPPIEMEGVDTHGPLDFSKPRDRAQAEALFESATCFVMPSQFEPFGIVYVEAAAAGVPSIGTVVGGARDAIGDMGGLLVDPSDLHALVEALEIMSNPSRASMMGAAALERSRLFTWRAVAERIGRALELYGVPGPGQGETLSQPRR